MNARELINALAKCSDDELEYLSRLKRENKLLFDSHRKGKLAEDTFALECERRGLTVECVAQKQYDKRVNGLRTQIKYSDTSRQNSICISQMRPVNGVRAYAVDEIDVMVVICTDGTWMFSAHELVDSLRPGYLRTSIRLSEWPSRKENWGIFVNSQQKITATLF